MKRTIALVATGLLSGLWTLNSTAATIVVDYEGFVNGSMTGKIRGVRDATVNAGQFKFDVEEDDDNVVYWSDELQAFCIDVTENLVTNRSARYSFHDAEDKLEESQLSMIGALYDLHAKHLGTPETDSAFQLVLWEIIYDYDKTLSLSYLPHGSFWAKNFGSLGIAKDWLGDISGIGSYVSKSYEFFVLKPKPYWKDNQSLLVARKIEVPEPGTLGLMGASLLAFCFAYRRRVMAAHAVSAK